MKELVLLEEPLPRVVAEDESLGALQEPITLDLQAHRQRGRRDPFRCFLHAIAGVRMRGEPLRHASAFVSTRAQSLQGLEHLPHFVRVVALLDHVLEAQFVRLGFCPASELEEEHPEALAGELAELGEPRLNDDRRDQPDLPELLLRHLRDGMFRRDVADFVAEHRDQLRLGIHVRQDAARDEHRSAGQRERVHDRVIDDVELPRDVRALRDPGDREPEAGDVALHGAVGHKADRCDGLLRAFLAHRDLVGF